MGYGDYAPKADKYLLQDGSITTFDNVEVEPADAGRALLYTQRASSVAKWLMPDGSIVSGLPVTISLQPPVNYMSFELEPSGVPADVGTLSWDEADKTLSLQLSSAVKLQIGQEQFIRAVNKSGSPILNGAVVYVSDAQGNRPVISLADANNYNNSQKVLGMVTADIPVNQEGYITISGIVRDLNTNAYDEGTCLYLSETAGQLTDVKPADGVARIIVGMVVKSHINDGWVCVRVHEDKYMFGDIDNGNYSLFEADGTYVAKGNAITYRDEYVGGEWFVPQGASAPDLVTPTIGGVVTRKYAFDGVNQSEVLGNTFEIAHDVALAAINAGTLPIEFHLHTAPSTVGTGQYRFVIDWCYIPPNGAPIAGTQLVILTNITTNKQYYNVLSGGNLAIPVGGVNLGGLIEFTVTRTPTHQDDTYADDVIFYKAALHVPCDTAGSRQTYIK
jgi:hypothetical protein